jgi:hypothetical protein
LRRARGFGGGVVVVVGQVWFILCCFVLSKLLGSSGEKLVVVGEALISVGGLYEGIVGAYVRCWLHMEVDPVFHLTLCRHLRRVRSIMCLFIVALNRTSNQIAINPPTSRPSAQQTPHTQREWQAGPLKEHVSWHKSNDLLARFIDLATEMVGFDVTPTLTLTPSINDLLSLCEALGSLLLSCKWLIWVL